MRVFVSRLLEIERTKSSVPVRTGTRACTSVTIAAHNHESPPRMPPTHVAAPMHVSTRPRAQTDCFCAQGAHRRRQRRRDQRARGSFRRMRMRAARDSHTSPRLEVRDALRASRLQVCVRTAPHTPPHKTVAELANRREKLANTRRKPSAPSSVFGERADALRVSRRQTRSTEGTDALWPIGSRELPRHPGHARTPPNERRRAHMRRRIAANARSEQRTRLRSSATVGAHALPSFRTTACAT